MNIAIGKIGQKIIFNRNSEACDRSNTNGNVGTYLLIKLLIENNKDDTFYIISNNDLDCFETLPFENVVDASKMSHKTFKSLRIDAMFILTGLTSFEQDESFIDVVNNLNTKYILLSDDPRCLDSVAEDFRFKRKPDEIISQFQGKYNFKDKEYDVKYIPIERASCYKQKIDEPCKKEIDLLIVSNTSGKDYDRVQIVSSLTKGMKGLNIYGRLSDKERKLLGESNCKGEVKYTEIESLFKRSFSTLIVPIKKDWVTSKYVEALMHNVIPIFHSDYNTSLLNVDDLIVVRNQWEFIMKYCELSSYTKKLKEWQEKLITPYVDGKVLSESLMNLI